MKIIVVSVPGGGKSTILNYVKKKLPKARIVTTGDIYFQMARKKFGIKDRDDLRKKLTLPQHMYVQKKVAEKVSKIKAKILFINTHITVKTPFGYYPATTETTMKVMKPDSIILLEFRPEDILARRLADKTRKRDIESLEAIEEHQIINRNSALDIASDTECPVKIINLRFKEKKPFDQVRKGAEEIVKMIKAME